MLYILIMNIRQYKKYRASFERYMREAEHCIDTAAALKQARILSESKNNPPSGRAGGEFVIVKNISQLCVKKHISIANLARKCGIRTRDIAMWDKEPPSVKDVQKVAKYFGVTVDDLLSTPKNNWLNINGQLIVENSEAVTTQEFRNLKEFVMLLKGWEIGAGDAVVVKVYRME